MSSGAKATSVLQVGCPPGYKRTPYRNNTNTAYSHAAIQLHSRLRHFAVIEDLNRLPTGSPNTAKILILTHFVYYYQVRQIINLNHRV
jgi:hypothetical protein